MNHYQAVRDRPFTEDETEQMRLLLSTFRDGSGQRVKAGFMPDFLSFERVTAYVLGGFTNEDKGVFDVAVPGGARREQWGVSCKMASAQPVKNCCWFMELSNSAKYLTDALLAEGIHWQTNPEAAGPILVGTVGSWHEKVRRTYDIDASKYLLLTHDSRWRKFEMAAFDIHILTWFASSDIEWVVEGREVGAGKPSSVAGYIEVDRRPHRLWQWYANSGGQLKFYPPIGWEKWRTGEFELSEPPVHDLRDKVEDYWPGAWPGPNAPGVITF
ncbi:hypothetical protein CJ178_30345 [Rhodococcus sp. ACPA4]|uniref:hypothetical protein n=1 Tax=Rhodococcus sp. ACPA4 TaxID=2028571 RepID=UPI000BB1118E|nr:hypothetical protein [Rhodococcus sp. ACPA4]PBC35773.1 hypothetical protein CJ178_30345 [Rhodococcus sp. ACPA4]